MNDEQMRSKPLRSRTTCCGIFFTVYLKESLPGIVMCKLCEANGDFTDADVWFGSPTKLCSRLQTKRKGHREALKEHEARGEGSEGGRSGGASREKDAGNINNTWMASSHSRTSRFVSSSTDLIPDGLGLVVVIDACGSSKIGRDI